MAYYTSEKQLVKKEADIIPIHKEEGAESEGAIREKLSELSKKITDKEEELKIIFS